MKATINKTVLKSICLLIIVCLSAFMLATDATAMGGGGGGGGGGGMTSPAVINPSGGALPGGETGTLYSTTITASGCDANYRWTLTSGNLPQGLSFSDFFSQTITISGMPELVETAGFTLEVVGDGCTSTAATFTLNVVQGNNPVITTQGLLYGLVGTAYSDTITGSLGTTDYGWSVVAGSLPAGLALDYDDAVPRVATTPSVNLSGTPTVAGLYTFTVMVTDSLGKTGSKDFTIDIQNDIQIITSSPLPDGMEGVPYSLTLQGIGGNSSFYLWNIVDLGSDPSLLPGLGINETTGELSGIPTQEGDYIFTVVLEDTSNGFAVTRDFTLKVYPNDLAFDTTVIPPDGVACTTYTANLAGTGGTQPYNWSLTAGLLPPGLTLAANGTPSTVISGTPREAGLFAFTVSLTDNAGVNRQRTFSISITGDPSPCSVNLDYNTAYPPFISTAVTPNVLLILDNSGSMYEFAYKDPGTSNDRSTRDVSYTAGVPYYGYFECDKDGLITYTYNAAEGYFEQTNVALPAADSFNGCFLNWLTMRRVDIARKVLTGGKYDSANGLLVAAERPNRNRWKGYDTQTYRVYYDTTISNYELIRVCTDGSSGNCDTGDGTFYNVRVKVNSEPKGIIQETYSLVRWGLMFFNTYEGGYLDVPLDGGPPTEPPLPPIDPDHLNTLVEAIRTTNPTTWTPLAETLYEATRYYQREVSAYNGGVDYSTYPDPMQFDCQKNFVLLLTDGESSKDENLPNSCLGGSVTDTNFDIQEYMTRIADNEGPSLDNGLGIGITWGDQACQNANSIDGTFYLEGVAYYANTNDMRPDLAGDQFVKTYTVFAFDESPIGAGILQTAAKYGAFKDSNDNLPYPIPDVADEWDKDADGIADRFFKASEGGSLAGKIKMALFDILQKKSSGTSAAVLATTSKGESAAYQAYFQPTIMTAEGTADWIGGVYGLFLDKYGNTREDDRGDARLCYDVNSPPGCTAPNKIIQMYYDNVDNKTYAKRYPGTVVRNGMGNGMPTSLPDGTPTGIPEEKIPIDDVKNLWNGGNTLWAKNADTRKIFTTLNGYEFVSAELPNIDPATGSTFYDGNAAELQVKLGAGDAAGSADIINYIRGVDIPGNRPRTIGIDITGDGDFDDPGEINVWKLGDIVYSTPVVVTRPRENYDFLYKDASYFFYLNKYFSRRHVVYAGANDGMLHAFNAGFYDARNLRYCKGGDTDADRIISDTECAGSGEPGLGEELWGFVPRGVLPTLKLLMNVDYTHVYYVDLKPKTTDVKIFDCNNPPDVHVGDTSDSVCWGTILIGGLRYGGKANPEYFALDITDPQNPRLLWTFSDPGMGFSMSRPAIAKTCDNGGTCKWFAIFGSGATDYTPDSDLTGFSAANGQIYVLDLSSGVNGVISNWTENTNFWKKDTGKPATFMSDPITVDGWLDYAVDVTYIAENYQTGGAWSTRILKLTTNRGTLIDPSLWTLSSLADVASIDTGNLDKIRRITSAPSISMDEQENMWVFFGTGQFLGLQDKNRTDTGAFYAVKDKRNCWDNNSCPEVTNLYNVSSDVICPEKEPGSCTATTSLGNLELDIEQNYDGWVMYFENLLETVDFTGATLLHTGERVLSKPLVLGGIVTWTTFIPGDEKCNPEGESNIYSVYYKTGSSYKDYVFNAQAYKTKQNNTPEAVARVKRLGPGMASSPSVQVTAKGAANITITDPNGQLLQLRTTPAFRVGDTPVTSINKEIYDPDCN